MMFNRFDIGNDGTLGLDNFSYGLSSSGGGSGNPLDWNAIINQAFAVGSHAISAFSGQNTGTQVGYNRSQGVFAIQGQPREQSGYGANPYAGMSPEQIAAYTAANRPGGLDSGLDAAVKWISDNPLVIVGVGVGAYLLMKEPPRSRR